MPDDKELLGSANQLAREIYSLMGLQQLRQTFLSSFG